jgi:3-phosphoshikimate 1-carboxyvinyltransferase
MALRRSGVRSPSAPPTPSNPAPAASRGPLRGTAPIPGDKSISHRALILAALAVGESRIEGLCEGLDLAATIASLRAMGAHIDRAADGAWAVAGVGTGALLEPASPLDMANSGTSARLLIGLTASHPIRAIFTGDSSLVRRPMDRVTAPLRRVGARIHAAPGERLPLLVEGAAPALPRRHRIDVPSAQVKSALLLAGLNTPGVTEIEEVASTRDHLERLLALFGGDIEVDGRAIAVRGEAELQPQHLTVPGDPSAAAFLTVAALIVPGSEVRIDGICVNPRRTGLYELLEAMGADFEWNATREVSGEPVADIIVRHSTLRGCEVPPEIVPRMIDEFPVFFIAAAFAEGSTRAQGLAELRVKESDRIAGMATGLRAIGMSAEDNEDGLTIKGSGGDRLPGGATIAAQLDHRVAMAFAVAGLHAVEPIGVAGMDAADTSFPDFAAILESLAAA